MAKRKYAEEQAPEAVEAVEQVEQVAETTETPTEAATPIAPKAPQYYLERDGVQYKFDKRELPKKAAVVGNILIDGVPTPFQVTSNKGWTPPENVIEYIWVKLPNEVEGYITLDYLVPAIEWDRGVATVGEGVANRTNPARIPKSEESETKRKAEAAKTLAAKKAAALAAAEAAAANPEGEGETTTEAQTDAQ